MEVTKLPLVFQDIPKRTERFDKEYAYSTRHNYGKKGREREWFLFIYVDWNQVPEDILESIWVDIKAIAVHNAGSHSFHYINHTKGRTSFNQIRRKMTAGGLAIDKMSVWKYTHNQIDLDVRPTMVCCLKITTLLKILEMVFSTRWSVKTGMDIVQLTTRMCFGARCMEMHLKSSQSGSQSSTVVEITKQVRMELRQELRDEIREELREEMRVELSTQIRVQITTNRYRSDLNFSRSRKILDPSSSKLRLENKKQILKQQQEEEERKSQCRQRKKEKKEKAAEEEAEVDANVAAMVGFGGFGSSKK
ncbi:hypothetical protein TEA_007381 [Camellia sinensis var. sinensis]|uniref:Uncharacterized protein n=1 Tax=Camellia sinensis var. sinensis TaxID=542762 RepID=A0A4S4D973_CAMSN|nr:hypothetical protein TEA_007381 [Camellia sinensis var. sinensis]